MRQILGQNTGVVVARMPSPIVEKGCVLVRVHYSLISTGTEIAGIKAGLESVIPTIPQTPSQAVETLKMGVYYAKASIRHPRKAASKVNQIVRRALDQKLGNPFSSPDNGEESSSASIASNQPPRTEIHDQGWNIGYSAAGEIVDIGEGVVGFSVGDWVSCAGAGRANHADVVSVPQNLVCRVPKGCSLQEAASTTVGTIALQGVRRADPKIGENICVIGLGLIGQITHQLLESSGCDVLGMDLDSDRVDRARKQGLSEGYSSAEELKKAILQKTGAHGVDATIITASSKSDAVINLAMEITRRKGRVIIVGDIGLNVARTQFYKKEIDLLMSSSYGPGRYDSSYEEDGKDYPFAYVRWTLNRNMQTYLHLMQQKKVQFLSLVDEV
ncbi:MAG: zinc-binding alcohol dehydrogenase, partial [Bdellovibrionales bacterium]|nr:zinc-binding alcohol dehydrogenase [Bdellovibrionales bacterium]